MNSETLILSLYICVAYFIFSFSSPFTVTVLHHEQKKLCICCTTFFFVIKSFFSVSRITEKKIQL